MREIEFRGKRTDNGEWVYGYYYVNTWWKNARIQCNVNGAYQWNVIPETVGQYTGLKDKDGKKIFEGDIIRHGDFNHKPAPYIEIGYIEYKNGGFCILPMDDFAWCEIDLEVIGNVYDNPELLEASE